MKFEGTFLNSKVARRIFFLFILSALTPMIALSLLSLDQVGNLLSAQVKRELHKETKAYGAVLYERLLSLEIENQKLASRLSREAFDRDDILSMVTPDRFVSFTLIDKKGQLVPIMGAMEDASALANLNEPQKEHLRAGKNVLVTDPQPGSLPRILVVRALNPSSLEEGVLIGQVDADHLWGGRDESDPEKDYCVLDHEDRELVCSRQWLQSAIAKVVAESRLSSSGQFDWVDQENHLISYWELFLQVRFFVPGWKIILSQPGSEIGTSASYFSKIFIIVFFLAIFLVALLSTYQIRKSLDPLEELMEGTRRIGNKEFKASVRIKSNDEFATLARSFNAMAEQLDRQFNVLKAMAEIDRLILSHLTVEDIIEITLAKMGELVPCDRLGVLLTDGENTGTVSVYDHVGQARSAQALARIAMTPETARRFTRKSHYLIAPDNGEWSDCLKPLAVPGITVFLVFPVVLKEHLSALICLGYRDERSLSNDLIVQGRDFADRVAVGLSKAAWEKQLDHQAHYDFLTDLPNRLLLKDRLRQALAQAKRFGCGVAVLFIDIDRFKLINDSLGHKAGDFLLVEVGRRLKDSLRQIDTIARLGGDEFVVVLSPLNDQADPLGPIAIIASRVLTEIAKPTTIEGHTIHVTASVGIALYPRDGDNLDDLLKNADAAMYHAKAKGKNNYQFYAKDLNATALQRLELETKLHRALETGEFELHYQPQIDIISGRIVGAEALLRWRHPQEGMISPGRFIPLAEQTGLIIPIEEWVFSAVARQLRSWRDDGLPSLRVAVNVSALSFRRPELASWILQALTTAGLEPSCLEIEITEGVAMENVRQAVELLTALDERGLKIAIDDFGTGYSSLNYLKHFPIHSLKIDQSFVRNLVDRSKDAAIVKSIIVLAHSLDLKVVAEGVETADQLDYLRAQGCQEAQGYWFSRPLPVAEFKQLWVAVNQGPSPHQYWLNRPSA